MTVAQLAACDTVRPAVAAHRPRLIAVGVRNAADDIAALRWAAAEAQPQDSVHVVHAFVPLRVDGCHWDPVRRARDARALTARRLTAQAVQRLRAMRVDIAVDGSAVAGLPADVLGEFSEIVDLMVLGDDAGASTGARPVTWQVQDFAACPVVCVPPTGARFHAPVTVVADDHGLAPAALRFGIHWAQRHDVDVQVSRTWGSLHEGEAPSPTWLAHQLEELDVQLADWQRRYPGIGITARIELGANWLTTLSLDSSLLVVVPGSAATVRTESPTALHCPTVVVPD